MFARRLLVALKFSVAALAFIIVCAVAENTAIAATLTRQEQHIRAAFPELTDAEVAAVSAGLEAKARASAEFRRHIRPPAGKPPLMKFVSPTPAASGGAHLHLARVQANFARHPGRFIVTLWHICWKKWVAGQTCVVDALNPREPYDPNDANDPNGPRVLQALARKSTFVPIVEPSAFPADPAPTSTPGKEVIAAKASIDGIAIGLRPSPLPSKNPALQSALDAVATAAPLIPGAARGKYTFPALPVVITKPKIGTAGVTFSGSVVPPAVYPPNGNVAQFGTSLHAQADMIIDLLISGREYKPTNLPSLALVDVVAASNNDGTKPTLNVNAKVLGLSVLPNGTALSLTQSLGGPFSYANGVQQTSSQDLCRQTQSFPVVVGISVTASLQCEISVGYGAYVYARPDLGELLATPSVRAYLIGAVDASALGTVVKGALQLNYNLFNVDAAVGVYERPVRNFFNSAVSPDAAFLAIMPYTYARGQGGGGALSFTLTLLGRDTHFVMGVLPPFAQITYPVRGHATFFDAISVGSIKDADAPTPEPAPAP